MIPNITRGGSTVRLMRYLIGRGRGGGEQARAEVHVDPHLVSGQPADLMLQRGGRTLTLEDARPMAAFLDAPMNEYGTAVTTAKKGDDGRPTGERQAAHVWHCSLSLHPEEPVMVDGRWRELVDRYVLLMGFDQTDTQAGCRWVAVRHGRSSGGNDHIHVVVNLVREDGTKADVHLDRPRAQAACRELEREFGLRTLEARGRGAGERGVKPAELNQDGQDVDAAVTARRQLERIVRACATAAIDEADFVARIRGEGVLVRPRFEQGGVEDVVGYSVALAPVGRGERPVWFGGGRLSRELTLPRLRAAWPELAAADRAAAWRRTGTGTRTAVPPSAELQAEAAHQLAQLRERLTAVRHEDQSTWAIVARDTAGILAAWSLRTEPTPGPLADAGRAIARSAQLRASRVPGRPYRSLPPAQNAAALLLRGAARPRSSRVLVAQLSSLTEAIRDMHQAAGELERARELEATALAQLAGITGSHRLEPGEIGPPPRRGWRDRGVDSERDHER